MIAIPWMVLFFCSVAEALGSYALEFLIIAEIYLVISELLFLVKDKVVVGPILEKFSEIFFDD